MTPTTAVLVTLLIGQTAPSEKTQAYADNPVYQTVRSNGLKVGDTAVTLPPPLIAAGASAEAERAALLQIAGPGRAAEDLTRDSVSAPFIMKTRDQSVGDRGVIRVADLWFVVRASLDDIDPEKTLAAAGEGQTVEAANMRFTTRRLDRPDADAAKGKDWYVHMTGRLLDRIHVEATDRIVATRSGGSWLIASRTDPKFNEDGAAPNRWFPIARKGNRDEPGASRVYPGGISYVTIGRLATVPGALLVEAHFAFFEPKAWFDGAPILRSKIGVVAQDRIRSLRRELAKSQKGDGRRSSSGPKGG